jgi:hypothetical protein
MRPWVRAALVACVALASGACADTSFHVEHAKGFASPEAAPIAVFGVYRDGRLAPEAWDILRPHIAPLFSGSACDPGYPDILTPSGTPVLQAVDDFSRDNGVTDELLARLGSVSKSDLILLVVMTGRPTTHGETSTSNEPTPQSAAFRGGGRRGMNPSPGAARTTTSDARTFELVGLVFSKKAHQTVLAVRLNYGGTSIDEALDAFVTKLAGELPRATCAGWSGDLHLEVGDVRRIGTE